MDKVMGVNIIGFTESGSLTMKAFYLVRSSAAPVDYRSRGNCFADRPILDLRKFGQSGNQPKVLAGFPRGLILLLALLVALAGGGCETFQDSSLTCDLWRKDPTATAADRAKGHDYLYGGWTRAGLTPLAVAGDATIIGVGLGVGCMIASFAEACRESAQNGGSTGY